MHVVKHTAGRIGRRLAPRPRRIAPRRLGVAALLGAAALLTAACGANEPAPPIATAEPISTADGPAPAQTEQVPAQTEQPRASVGVRQVTERSDGLTGEPVPPPTARSVAFDAALVDERAGAFPPLDFPAVVPAGEASWMSDDDLVLGAVQNGAARAYPIFMLRFHHVANDELGGGGSRTSSPSESSAAPGSVSTPSSRAKRSTSGLPGSTRASS